MELNISLLVVDAAEDAVSLQKAILTPLATQLSTRAESRPTEASLPQEMALKIRNILEAFAGRSHISRRTEDGFIAAFGFLAPNPAAIPSITAEHEGTITALRDILCTDVDRPLRVVPPADANLFTLMGATLLAAARAMAPHGEGETSLFGTSSVLANRRAATEFVFNMHRRLLFKPEGASLSHDDRLKIRMILDIVEGRLPPREAPTLEERLSPEGFAALMDAMSQDTAEAATSRS